MSSTGLSASLDRSPRWDKQKPGAASKKRKVPLTTLVGVGSIVVVLTIWSLLSAFVFSETLLPSPLVVLEAGVAMARDGSLARDVGTSLRRLILGYLIGVTLGVVLGSICGRLRWVRAAVLPLINSIRPLSPVALTPLFIIWFGIGEPSKVLLVSYTTTVTLFFSTMSGVASTPTIRERAAKSLGASKLAFALQVVVPSSVPFILTGLRIAISQAYMAVVAAELIGASSGLGYLIMSSRMNLLTQRMFVGLVALAILGLLTDFIVRRLVARYGGRFLGDDASRSV